jgi:tetratricopeptide (TPR) repeat protein
MPTAKTETTALIASVRKKGRLLGNRRTWIVGISLLAITIPVCAYFAFALFIQLGRASRRMPDQADRNAVLLAQEGEWKKAFAVVNEAITQEPHRPSHWMTRADLEMMYGDYAAAAQDCETVLRLDPDCDAAKQRLKEASAEREKNRKRNNEQELTERLQLAQESVRTWERAIKESEEGFRLYGGEAWGQLVRDSHERLRGAQEEVRQIQTELRKLRQK